MLHQDLRTKAHYLAYRWFRSNNLEATHSQGQFFADGNWRDFLDDAREQLTADQAPLLMDCDPCFVVSAAL